MRRWSYLRLLSSSTLVSLVLISSLPSVSLQYYRFFFSFYQSHVHRHHIADGATWKPPRLVPWLFNDMAIPPHKSVDVLENWISARLCHRFIWTLKFTSSDYSAISHAHSKLSKHEACRYQIRHLSHQGNEAVVLGTVLDVVPSASCEESRVR